MYRPLSKNGNGNYSSHGDDSYSYGHTQSTEHSSPYHRRPLPAYTNYEATSNPSISEPMGIIPSSRYTYASNPIPSPIYTSADPLKQQQSEPLTYKYNKLMSTLLLPTGFLLLSNQQSTAPSVCFLFIALIVYALDLIHSRDGVLCITWLAVPLLSLVMGWSWLAQDYEDDATQRTGGTILRLLFQTGAAACFWALVAAWGTLQFPELLSTFPTITRQMEASMHATAPLILASFVTHSSIQYVDTNYGPDAAATFAPHVFALFLWLGMILVGSCRTSFPTKDDKTYENAGKLRKPNFIVTSNVALSHLMVLLLAPASMHVVTFWRRLLSRMADFDDWFDWFLALAIPYLLMTSLGVLSKQTVIDTPYASLPVLRQSGVLPLVVLFLSSLAIQQRYLIPAVHEISYHYTGVKQSSWMLCLYWTLATVTLLLTTWLWGRTSQGQPFLGEYHEDVLQLLLSLLGLLLGKGLGMPWNFAPLPILAFLGLSLWLSTRMLRYLGIVLFVFLASAFVIFTYRFAGIDHTLTLPFPIKSVSLIWFGMIVVGSSALIGLVTGLAIRAPGGFLSNHLKHFDLSGILLVIYTLVSMEIEIALIKRESTWAKLIGVHMVEDATVSDLMYSPELAYATSLATVGLSRMMLYFGLVKALSSWIAIAFAVGKAFTIFSDTVHSLRNMHPSSPTDILFDAILFGVSFLIMAVPHVFLSPVHLKASTRYQRNITGGPILKAKPRRIIILYACILLPVAIMLAEFAVVEPMVTILRDSNSNMSVAGCAVLVLGACLCMWAVSLLSMLNHYLPDGGGEKWKKASGFVFLLGVMTCFAFPMFNSGTGRGRFRTLNPYKLAAVSTIGRDLVRHTRSRTGGWGILSSLIATLLAVAGPLELRERRTSSGAMDKSLLIRTTVFSLLFGGGVAWFVTVQLMNESGVLSLVFTTISSMMVAFLCTITSVLGYFIELENFDDTEQLGNTVLVSFVAFLMTAGIPSFLKMSSGQSSLGSDSWLTTYLAICSMFSFLISVSLGLRQSKDIRTRGLANCFCLFSWFSVFILVLNTLAGARSDEDNESNTLSFTGFGILAAISVLFFLQGESPSTGAGRRILRASKSSSFKLSLPLHRKSRTQFMLSLGTTCVFLVAVLHFIWGKLPWRQSSGLSPDHLLETLRQSTLLSTSR
jgi:hypothetical protein